MENQTQTKKQTLKEINFEVYTINPETGQSGWDIKFVSIIAESKKQAREFLKLWPLFDCVILHNYEIDTKVSHFNKGDIYDTDGFHNIYGKMDLIVNVLI